MESGGDVDSMLDYAIFQKSSTENSYEALVCTDGKIEKLACGSLDLLALHLPQAKAFHSMPTCNNFKLQPKGSPDSSSWFTKLTLARFLQIINSSEAIRSITAIEIEISQLEDAKRFHLNLYSQDYPNNSEGDIAGGYLKDARTVQKIKVETTSDAAKNELLQALDLRLTALKEELALYFNRAVGASLSVKQISDLAAFVEHFGVKDLRNPLLKYMPIIPKDQLALVSDEKSNSDDRMTSPEDVKEDVCLSDPEIGKAKPVSTGISPAKIAQAERQSSTESEGSSESSDEDQAFIERSRPLIRSASPKRSASPMRRIQIGRSGSRRSAALTIKSLGYFPVREKISSNKDADENNCGDEPDQPSKKPEITVRRMSVQDAINLFESKQKDQNLDDQKRRASGEVSLSMNKSVLRRWSAGMSDSLTCSQENTSESAPQNISLNLVLEMGEDKSTQMEVESDATSRTLNSAEIGVGQLQEEKTMIPSSDIPAELTTCRDEQINDKVTTIANWSRQKETELNQMLSKMTESKPEKNLGTNAGNDGILTTYNEQKGGFYSQYKEKRDEKLRAESAGRRSVMEAQFKVLKETLELSKAERSPKTGGITRKIDSPNNSQKPRRNSSPPVLPKQEAPKAVASRKPSPKASPIPPIRGSLSSGSLTKANGSQQSKTSTKVTTTNTTPNRLKSNPSFPSPACPKPERLLYQPKGKQGTKTQAAKSDVKATINTEEEKKQKATSRTRKSLPSKAPLACRDDSGLMPAKPSFYSKVTKKSSVVPLEGKPYLKRGSGTGPVVGSPANKTQVSQTNDLSKNNGNLVQAEEKKPAPETTKSTTKVLEVDLAQQANDLDADLDISVDNNLNLEKTENPDKSLAATEDGLKNLIDPVAEIKLDEEIGISSATWVEVEHDEVSTACGSDPSRETVSPVLVPPAFSQMLQADSCEPEITEWGNAENPPALVYQKDAPKGLKRLLKFARKGKGEANVTGCASPSIFSEGEDDTVESRAPNKKNFDISRKSGLQAKGYDQQKIMLSESLDGGNLCRSAVEYHSGHEDLSAQSNTSSLTSSSFDKLRESHVSSSATSTKATRSFFSFSAFRSGKSSEAKTR